MIKFESVSKSYISDKKRNDSFKDLFSFSKDRGANVTDSTFLAVDDVSFAVEKGSSIGILGRNGAGKSTILKLLTRIILPSQGRVVVNGNISCLLEVGAGFHQDLSGYENILLSGAILGMKRKEILNKIEKIIDFSEINDFISSPVKHYSSGMYLRLAFSVGVHLDSDILVIDEALAVGDSLFQEKCLKKIKEIKKEGKTIVFVSHDAEQVRAVCDQCIVMAKGKILYIGKTDKAIKEYKLSIL
ncbi:ABC transporter ATP-binding protein [Yersinia intermedia]|uniref:Teichoic acid ABC transporter ATP-binding protein n=1 Tax=Yersinia intermedia TaxID=631 RepID=A0A208ZZF3_YERIN|nr:ABC transporter ATP-binding protein [Yersinia intermedia]MCB5311238.1 ABC transporter ATP-binding protein [Yersinia intermedia]MCB5321137.1 ABC transporter ATP-binding protein [Yersinia intermedia]MCB5325872.1 ABC transporter ATP-binding protein [Yersinia intermedia]OVZ85897.1 teichoic acid ABC transporter ATP-binding protein [Yersinia intermedia]UNK22065.1 ABC transporter ATP-binding protein [Yersinia intermedia]